MHDIPDAFCSHKTSGRMRLKIPSMKRKEEYFASLKEKMSELKGIKKIEVNPLTGSVLLTYTCDTKEIIYHGESSSIFKIKGLNQSPSNIHQRVSATFKDIDKGVKGITGGEMDLGTLTFLALIGAGIYQIRAELFIITSGNLFTFFFPQI